MNKKLNYKIKSRDFFPSQIWAQNMGVHYILERGRHGKIRQVSIAKVL